MRVHEVPFIYAYLCKFIIRNMGERSFQELTQRYIIDMIHRHIYHIPRVYFSLMVKEMIEYGLITNTNGHMHIYKDIEPLIQERMILAKDEAFQDCSRVDKIPFFYLLIFKRMLEVLSRKNSMVNYVQIIEPWKTYIPNLSRDYDKEIIREMIAYGFIRKIDGHKYVFNGASSYNKLKKIEEFMPWG